jgi:hypothetical protein
MLFFKVLVFLLMFFATICALSYLQQGKKAEVNGVLTARYMTAAACIAIAFTTVLFDLMCVLLILRA